MNESPNTVGDQSAFWQRQRELTQGRIEDHPDVKPNRINWLIWPALVIGLVACVAIASI